MTTVIPDYKQNAEYSRMRPNINKNNCFSVTQDEVECDMIIRAIKQDPNICFEGEEAACMCCTTFPEDT